MAGELYNTALQAGLETTAGSQVPATRRLYMTDPKFNDAASVAVRRVATGTRDNVRSGNLGSAMVVGSASMELDANEIIEMLLLAMKGAITPTTPGGATNARLWTFVPGDLASATIEWFDGFRGWDVAGARINSFALTGDVASGEANIDLEFLAMSITQATITAALAQRTPTVIRAWEAAIAIDALGATPGTTPISCVVTNYSLSFNNQMQRLYAANATRNACAVNAGEIDCTLELTVRASKAESLTEFNAFVAGTNRLVQLSLGNTRAIDAGVPNYEFVKFNVPAFWTGVDLGADSQGERAYVLTGQATYDSANAYSIQALAQSARTAAW